MSIILGLFTYFVLGLIPLTALWIGLLITGLSILLTPSYAPKRSREISNLMNKLFINITLFLEALRISSYNLFKTHNDEVFIYLSREEIREIPKEAEKQFITYVYGAPLIRLVSPINRDLVKDFTEPCVAIDHILTEYLDIADRVECYDEEDKIMLKIFRPLISSSFKLERSLGGLYGLIAGSVYALLRGDVEISYVETSTDFILIGMRIKK